jgi:sulfite reductase alpha subunit-like flavoprotein
VFLHGGLQRASNREGLLKAKNIRYTVLGLGDQNYSAFMEIPRQFTKQMDYLGATAFYPRGEADEVEVSQPASLRAYFIQPASLSCITQLHHSAACARITQLHAPASLSCMRPHHSAACALHHLRHSSCERIQTSRSLPFCDIRGSHPVCERP